jgi:hypothetical protein
MIPLSLDDAITRHNKSLAVSSVYRCHLVHHAAVTVFSAGSLENTVAGDDDCTIIAGSRAMSRIPERPAKNQA